MSETNYETGMRVGVFDSGLGGLSVLDKALEILPNEKFLYYADVDNVPYGNKTRQQIVQYVDEAVDYMIGNRCKAILIACNTATSAGVSFLRKKYDFIPIIGIEPAVKPAVLKCDEDKRVLVLATPITINGQKLDELIKKFDTKGQVDKLATPKLVEFAENGEFDTEIIVPYLREELKGFDLDQYSVIVLGCTHFPFFKDSFRMIAPKASIIDGSKGSANYVRTRMAQEGMLAHVENREFTKEDPRIVLVESGRRINDSGEIDKIQKLLQRLRKLG